MNKGHKVEDWSEMKSRSRPVQVYFSRYYGVVGSYFFVFLLFFSQSRNWRGRSVSSIPGGVYIAPAVAGCVRFLDLAGRAGFNLLAPTDVYTGCTCVKTPDSKPNVLYISARYLKDENLLASNYWLRGLNNCCSSIVIYLLISDNFYLWYNLDEFLYDGFFCESKT